MSQANATPRAPQDRILTGLVGRHIGASRSPWLHEREAQAQGLALTYSLLDFAALGREESDLCTQLGAAASSGYAGLNITHPYKQAVIRCLDELAPSAARVGAVNTVKFAAGKRIGHNTDVVGFAESMRDGLPDAALELRSAARRRRRRSSHGAGAARARRRDVADLRSGTSARNGAREQACRDLRREPCARHRGSAARHRRRRRSRQCHADGYGRQSATAVRYRPD